MAAEWIEQIGHFWMGVGCGITNSHILLWRREKIKQWPPATQKHPTLWSCYNRYTGRWESFETKPTIVWPCEQYHPDSRVQDMNTDEKWYHYGYMTGGFIKDAIWMSLCLYLLKE